MRRKILAVILVFLTSCFLLAAEEDEWYWEQPITKIDFSGLKNIKKSDLSGVVSPFIDKPFSDDVYNDILDRLYALDYFDEITPYAKHASKSNSNVLLVFEVVERPVIKEINFNGNKKIRNGELREQIKLKASDIYIESKALIDERIIRNHYLKKGYTASSVTHNIEEDPDGGIILNFEITEGLSTVIKEINFTGNTIFSARALKGKISLKEAGFLKDGAYQPSMLEQDKQTIASYYHEKGYADATVVDVVIDGEDNIEKQRNELTITFVIQEGAKYTYGGLTVSGNQVFSTQELIKSQKLKVGAVYNETKFQEDIRNIVNVYYENGYMSNEFYPVASKDSDRHEISYELNIREHERSHIENVIIKGNTKTKEYVISREIPITAGDVYSKAKIETGLRSLMNLRYFSNVLPEVQQGSEDKLVDLIVNVEETSTSSFNFGLTFSGATDPNQIPISLFLKLENSNLWGEGKTLSASTTISNTEQSVDLTYSQNWIGSYPIAFAQSIAVSHSTVSVPYSFWNSSLDYNQQYYYMNYQNWAATLSSGITRRWIPDYAIISASAGISNSLSRNIFDENVYIPLDYNVSLNANRWGLSNSVYTSLSVDNRDLSYDPTKGWFGSQRFTWHGLIPGLEKEMYLRSDTKLEGYLKLLHIPFSEAWSLRLVLAGYTGLSLQLPTYSSIGDGNKLYIDGMFNGRGWNDIYNQAKGMAMLSNKLELRMPIVPGVIGVDFFWDAAAIKDTASDLSNLSLNDFYFSYGPAIRFLIPQFPLHLLFAWKYRIIDGVHQFDDSPFNFVLSFSITNN